MGNEELDKMAIADLQPGKPTKPHPANHVFPHTKTLATHDYSHIIPKEHQADYKLHVATEQPHVKGLAQPVEYRAKLYHSRNGMLYQIGNTDATLPKPKNLAIDFAQLGNSANADEHRGKGLGLAMYEALLAHGKHHLGATHVVGSVHSSLASGVHQKLATKHGMSYKARPNLGTTKYPMSDEYGDIEPAGPLTMEQWKRLPPKPFDDRYGPYKYAIKNELRKKEVNDVASVAVFDRQGRLLFGKRNDNGKWTLPGGHFEVGESANIAARRELKEETGLKGTNWEYLGDGTAGTKIIHCFRCNGKGIATGDSDPDGECSIWRWVDVSGGLPDEIAENLHSPKNITLRHLGLQEEVQKAEATATLMDERRGTVIRNHHDVTVYDWSHLLTSERKDEGYFLQINDQSEQDGMFCVALMFKGVQVGELYFYLVAQRPGLVRATDTRLDKDHDKEEFQNIMYEAAMVHAKQVLSASWIEDKVNPSRVAATYSRIKSRRSLAKNLSDKFLAIAAGASLAASAQAAPVDHVYGKQDPMQWTPKGLVRELFPIAHLESAFGKQLDHLPHSKGEFHTAFGAVGFKPVTAYDVYNENPSIQVLYPGLQDHIKFTERFKSDPAFYNLLASVHWRHLKKLTNGDAAMAAYGWRWGEGQMARTDPLLMAADPYVQGFQRLLDRFVPRAKVQLTKSRFEVSTEEWLKKAVQDYRIYDLSHDHLHLLQPEMRDVGSGTLIEPIDIEKVAGKLKQLGYHGYCGHGGETVYFQGSHDA